MLGPNIKRKIILESAEGLILKHGPSKTSMEAIARAAGIAKPTLYAYYPDKEAVFTDLADRLVAGWREAFLSPLSGDGDIVVRAGAALTAKSKAGMRLAASPHATEITDPQHRIFGPPIRRYEDDVAAALEAALAAAGATRARLLAQLLMACSAGIGHKAQSPAELGPALRLLCERLIRPELP